jgi:hypothetical protein
MVPIGLQVSKRERGAGSPLLRLLLAGCEVIFVVCRSHEDADVVVG